MGKKRRKGKSNKVGRPRTAGNFRLNLVDALDRADYCARHEGILAGWRASGSCAGDQLRQSIS